VLLDEPTEGLAPQIVEDVYEVIEELSGRSMTILLVEQNVEMTLQLSSYNYILDGGRIVSEGTSEEVRANDDLNRYLSVGTAEN
jgi:branched-chain amino acid transport system ATP-binding protein